MVVGCIMQYRQYILFLFFLKSCPVPYTNFGIFNFILCNCSFGEPSFQRFWNRKSNVTCRSVSTTFDTCVAMSLEFFICQTVCSQGNSGICSGGFLSVATLLKTVLQKMYHWMIHCSYTLLGCQPVVPQLYELYVPFPFPHLQFKGSQWGALPSVCTQMTVWHPGVAVGRRLEMFTWLSAHWISELNMGRPLWSLHKLWGLGCGKERWERVHSLQQCFPIICHPNTWLHFSDSLNKIQTWWIYAMVVSENAILFCFDSQSLSISAVWSSLLLCTSSPSVQGQIPQHQR